MSITSQHHSLPLRPRSQDAPIHGMPSPAQRASRRRPVEPRPSGVPAIMGPPNHVPGVPVMGAPSPVLQLGVIGGPDVGPRLDPMGGPDTGRHVDVMGESDLTFVDCLFAQRRSLR
jgi:hypothetical protein